MKHISKLTAPSLPKESGVDLTKTEKFHGLSYYLNGGIDLSGEALDRSADVEFDNEEQLKELEAEGAMSVPYGDPKMSKFRLVEQFGKEAKKMASKSANPMSPEPTTTTTTTTE